MSSRGPERRAPDLGGFAHQRPTDRVTHQITVRNPHRPSSSVTAIPSVSARWADPMWFEGCGGGDLFTV
eukprot:6829045-Prymnesium_polylepis.2